MSDLERLSELHRLRRVASQGQNPFLLPAGPAGDKFRIEFIKAHGARVAAREAAFVGRTLSGVPIANK